MTFDEPTLKDIKRQHAECRPQVQKRHKSNIPASLRIAVPEFAMQTQEADYLLYAGGKVMGFVEATPKGHPLVVPRIPSTRWPL
jgi:hypothetical protein